MEDCPVYTADLGVGPLAVKTSPFPSSLPGADGDASNLAQLQLTNVQLYMYCTLLSWPSNSSLMYSCTCTVHYYPAHFYCTVMYCTAQ